MLPSVLLRRQLLPSLPRLSHATRSFSSTPTSQWARMFLVGHLGADPELQKLGDKEIVKYVIGTEYGRRENRQTSWFRVSSFTQEGPGRDFVLSLTKGTLVAVEGEAVLRKLEDNEGRFRSVLNITQRSLEVLRRPTKDPETEGDSGDPAEGSEAASNAS